MKNKDILLDVIGDTDENLVPELTANKKKSSIFKWTAFGGVCAAAVIAGMILLPKMNHHDNNTSPYSTLPQGSNESAKSGEVKIKSNVKFGGMGFEGLMAYDISELDTPNPWNPDLTISSLPVYRNLSYTDLGMSVYLSEAQMQEIAHNTASALKVAVDDTKVTYVKDFVQLGAYDDVLNRVFSVDAKCSDKTTITVRGDGNIRVSFEEKSLPSAYNFSYNNTSKEEAQQVLDYLSKKYADLLCFENHVCHSFADRSYSADESRSYYIYNRSDDVVQDILNYNLSYSSFSPDDNGDLMCIWLNNPLCASEYVGDYPIITEQDATKLLLTGNYYSSVPKEYIRNGAINSGDIAKTELVYRDAKDEYYQPYYKYYIELDTTAFNVSDGLKNYGIFYVPAISSDHLDDFNPSALYKWN